MLFNNLTYKFCGFVEKKSKQDASKIFRYVNLKDSANEICKFSLSDEVAILPDLKDGDKVLSDIEYNPEYKSLKVVKLVKAGV